MIFELSFKSENQKIGRFKFDKIEKIDSIVSQLKKKFGGSD